MGKNAKKDISFPQEGVRFFRIVYISEVKEELSYL
jgi:hypothetical protein